MTDSDVKEMIAKAWKSAWEWSKEEAQQGDKEDIAKQHRKRSARWVDELAKELARLCGLCESGDGDVRVFWRGERDSDFKLNELLFDIAVCDTEETESIEQQKVLRFVSRCLWLVESELANDSREIIVDLSKLVMGSSEFKLFVAGVPLLDTPSRNRREEKILKMCKRVADRCSGTLYFCFIPYPSEWKEPDAGEYEPAVWVWRRARWHKISVPL